MFQFGLPLGEHDCVRFECLSGSLMVVDRDEFQAGVGISWSVLGR